MGITNGKGNGQGQAVDPADDDFDDFDEPDERRATGVATPDSTQNEEVSPQRQQRLERRRQQSAVVASDDRLTEALEGKSESFKNHVYELMMEYKLDRDDPALMMLIMTGRLELLLQERPDRLSALFDRWENRLFDLIAETKEVLKQHKQTAIQAQEIEIAKSVSTLMRKATFDKFIHSFTFASCAIASALTAFSLMMGAIGGYQYKSMQLASIEYAPGAARRLTKEESQALDWAMSAEGERAKNLLTWNQDLLYNNACEAQAQQLGLTLELQGQKAKKGACVLWTRPVQERDLQQIEPRSKKR
jgi:hypothetical protein